MKRLLAVHHTVSPATHALHLAALDGARDPLVTGVEVESRPALVAGAAEALAADGYLLSAPVNLGYLAGALKHFLDQVYYPCLGATGGRPVAVWLHAGGDATGALRAVESILVAGLGWRPVRPPLVVSGSEPADLAAVRELAATVAAVLMD